MKKNMQLVCFAALFAGIYVTNAAVKAICPKWTTGANEGFPGAIVIVLFLSGCALYTWRSDISGFLKRLFVSVPFGLVFMLSLLLLYPLKLFVVIAGLSVCILLCFKTPSWGKHFLAILTPVVLLAVTAKLLNPLIENPGTSSRMTMLAFPTIIPMLSFLLLYLSKLWEQDTISNLRAILIRSLKFSVASSLFFTAFLVLSDLGDRLSLNLPVQLLLNTVLAILFLAIAYKYDLLLIERKKRAKRRSRSDELESESEGFSFNEREEPKR